MTSGPYAAAAWDYWRAGWKGVLPLPPKAKKSPPEGYTGNGGDWPSPADIQTWVDFRPDSNLALRAPKTVVGVDVDAYGRKRGAKTLAELEAELGPLPLTVVSTSRTDDVSGIYWYRVPERASWRDPGADIELIHFAHRYAVVWPSVHPATGAEYRWTDRRTGEVLDRPPRLEDPSWLPAAWVDYLSSDTPGPAKDDVTTQEVRDWFAGLPDGPRCQAVTDTLTKLLAALEGDGSRHEAARGPTAALVRLGEVGHHDVRRAVSEARDAFLKAVTVDGEGKRTNREAAAEWARLVVGGYAIVKADPTSEHSRRCLCLPPFTGEPAAGPAGLVVRQLSSVEPEALYPLWGGRLFRRKLAAIGGPPGVGKSYLTLVLASAVSTGAWVTGDPSAFPLGDVLIASYEDGAADTLRPRLEALSADLTRVHVIEGVRERDNGGIRPFGPADVDWFARHLAILPAPRLLIIDPVSAWVGAGVDEYRSNEVRGALEGLRRIAETYDLAVILVMHLRKQAADTALNRFNGSGAYGQLVRSALVCGRDPDDEKRCAVAHVKHNLTAQLPTLGYRVDDGGFWWLGEVDGLDGERLAGHDPNDERTARDDAVDFLRTMLADGSRLARDVQDEARSVGISERTLKRAKKLLGVISSKAGLAGGWQWSLPPSPEGGQGGPQGHTQKGGPLQGPLAPFGDSESQPQRPGSAATTTEGNGNQGPVVVFSPPTRPCEVCERPCAVDVDGQRVHPSCARTGTPGAA